MAAVGRMKAAVALVTVAQTFRTDGEDGLDRTDLETAGVEEVHALFADGVAQGLMSLVRLVDLAVTYAAGTQRQSRQDAWRIVASSAIDLAGPGPASADLIDL